MEDCDGLLHLLKAPSKKVVSEVCNRISQRLCGKLSDDLLPFVQSQLSLNDDESKELITPLTCLLQTAIYHGCTDKDSVHALLPKDFHSNLRDLLTKVILDNQPRWRENAIDGQVSLPKLKEFHWNLNTDDNSLAPSCVLHLETSDKTSVDVEMSRETLDTMIDSLAKIRDQISSVA